MPLKKAVKWRESKGDQELAKERRDSLRKEKVVRELRYGVLNEKRNLRASREEMMKVKLPIVREDVEVTWKTFDRSVDAKDHKAALTVEAVETARQQYNKNVSAHAEAIDRFIQIYGTRLRDLEERYRNNLEFLVTTYMKDRRRIEERQNDDEVSIQTVIFTNQQKNEEVCSDGRGRIIAKVDTQKERNDNARRVVAVLIESQISHQWNELRKIVEDYESVTKPRRRAFQALKKKDEHEREIIESQVSATGTLFESIRKLKEKIENFGIQTDERISQIGDELKFFQDAYRAANEKFISEQKRGKSQMIFLTKQFNSTVAHLKKIVDKAERILLLVYECSKYETEDEKVLQPCPMDENFPRDETEIDDFRALDAFWKRVGGVKIIATELELERSRLAEESIILKENLRQCLMERNIC